jgi:hypothetical protein
MTIDVDPDWWKTLFDEVYLMTDARSVGRRTITRQEIDIFTALVPMQPGTASSICAAVTGAMPWNSAGAVSATARCWTIPSH